MSVCVNTAGEPVAYAGKNIEFLGEVDDTQLTDSTLEAKSPFVDCSGELLCNQQNSYVVIRSIPHLSASCRGDKHDRYGSERD